LAKEDTFNKSVEMALFVLKKELTDKIEQYEILDRTSYLEIVLKNYTAKFSKYDKIKLIERKHSEKYKGIDGKLYAEIKSNFEKLEKDNNFFHLQTINDFQVAVINYGYTKFCHSLLGEDPYLVVEAYTNLPHVLCILDDLGILEIIEEKFKTKNYSGTAMQKDKTKLLATILNIQNPKDIDKLRKSFTKINPHTKQPDYLSDKSKKNAVNTLKSLGLEPSKFID
jgi:hypothetical protein